MTYTLYSAYCFDSKLIPFLDNYARNNSITFYPVKEEKHTLYDIIIRIVSYALHTAFDVCVPSQNSYENTRRIIIPYKSNYYRFMP